VPGANGGERASIEIGANAAACCTEQVKKRLAQVKGRKLDVLLQWWLQHGRDKCFADADDADH
jgi:hypothetical protein